MSCGSKKGFLKNHPKKGRYRTGTVYNKNPKIKKKKMKKYYTYKTKMVTKADCKAYCDINGCDMFDSFL